MPFVNPVWTDQVDFRPVPYQPARPSALKVSLITAAAVFGLGIPVIAGSLARLPDIDPTADPGLVVDYAAQPPADRGLLVVAPAHEAPLAAALAEAPAPVVKVRPVAAEITGPGAEALTGHFAHESRREAAPAPADTSSYGYGAADTADVTATRESRAAAHAYATLREAPYDVLYQEDRAAVADVYHAVDDAIYYE